MLVSSKRFNSTLKVDDDGKFKSWSFGPAGFALSLLWSEIGGEPIVVLHFWR